MTENFMEWQERLRPLIEARIQANKDEKQAEAVAKICDALFDKHPDMCKAIADELVRRLMHEDNVEEVDEEEVDEEE